MSSSGRDTESWDQGHGTTAGDSSRSPAGEREGQIQAGCLAEASQKDWGGQCLYSSVPLVLIKHLLCAGLRSRCWVWPMVEDKFQKQF